MTPLTRFGEWTLFLRAQNNGWHSFKLSRNRGNYPQRVKCNFWLNWNGERLARNRDAHILEEHHPELHSALVRFLHDGL